MDHRLSQLDRMYAAVRAEVNARRMHWLELLTAGLIAFEIALGLLRR